MRRSRRFCAPRRQHSALAFAQGALVAIIATNQEQRPKAGRKGRQAMALSRRRFLASAAAVSASGVFAPAIAQSNPLRIGILAPRSGIAAAPGLNGIRATDWAVERYNAQGGIGGRKVDCVQGIISTGVGLALGPVVEEARALTLYWDGTTQDGVDETIANPRYLF